MLALVLLAQLAAIAPRPVTPVLGFPDAALDDTAAYRGYQTRFFRDAARNTLQVYIDDRSARVVHLLADADNASIGFTARDAAGHTAPLHWDGPGATVSRRGRTRTFTHRLAATTGTLHLGWFQLGTMRVERDLQYDQKATGPFSAAPYRIGDVDRMLAALADADAATRTRHLARLNAPSVEALRARVYPQPTLTMDAGRWVARVRQLTLDARDTLTLELSTDPAQVTASIAGDSVTLTARGGTRIAFDVRISTTARALTPLTREQIFTSDFLRFVHDRTARARGAAQGDTAAISARRMERQVLGVELLVSREKLMAGLPTYATYFGRDMLMTALMMRPIWRHETFEAVIAAALRKLAPDGQVSHEEALGDQAVREAAGEYATLTTERRSALQRGDQATAARLLARADTVVATMRRTRENYHMIDDEHQFAIVVARWITDPTVSPAAKRAFLLDTRDGGGTRAERLLQELALVARLTAPYAKNPVPENLIGFQPGGPLGFQSASWRDSGAGYAGGKFAMDINTIWVPHALEATGQILAALRDLTIPTGDAVAADTPLGVYARNPSALAAAVTTWRDARRHFLVTRSADEVRRAAEARMAVMPAEERAFWSARPLAGDALTFAAVSLDANGAPIAVANTDPATQLFLGDGEGRTGASTAEERAQTLQTVRLFARPYPTGLLVAGLGPVVANDSYATPSVWASFVNDLYHSPKVVWGREVNLFLLGVAQRISQAQAAGGDPAYVAELRSALDVVRSAVEQSGFHTELWSYRIEGGRLGPMRYGSGSDIQLWSTTDLAVQYELARLRR